MNIPRYINSQIKWNKKELKNIFCYILCTNEWAIYFPSFKKETKMYRTETNENGYL